MNHALYRSIGICLLALFAQACSNPAPQGKPRSVNVEPPAKVAAPAPATTASSPAKSNASGLEMQYLASDDLETKIRIMGQLSESSPMSAVQVVGRLFHYEPDNDLKEELLSTLLEIEGQPTGKLQLLKEAVQSNE